MNTLIKKAELFLKRKFGESKYLSAHPEEKAYRLKHSYRVANIGKTIAEKEGFPVTEMVITCLLQQNSLPHHSYYRRARNFYAPLLKC